MWDFSPGSYPSGHSWNPGKGNQGDGADGREGGHPEVEVGKGDGTGDEGNGDNGAGTGAGATGEYSGGGGSGGGGDGHSGENGGIGNGGKE